MSEILVSAVIKAKNEASQIGDCIESLKGFADEIIVVDDESADETVNIAEKHEAKVVHSKSKRGFINELDKTGFLAAGGEWLLRIDADERMTKTLGKELRRVCELGKYSGVSFARKNMMFGDWAQYGGWFKNDQVRFFKADAWDRSWSCEPHTQVPVSGEILSLPLAPEYATEHYDYNNVAQFVDRSLYKYTRTEAVARHANGVRFSLARMCLKPLKRFLGRFFIRQGFRDGMRGFLLAVFLGMYDFLIEANLWDIERREHE